jgi:FAD:protein FMN transferase
MVRISAFIAAGLVLAASSAELATRHWKLDSDSAPLHRYEAVEPHMGTLARITVHAASEAAARRAFRAGFDRLRELDATLSDYKADSELNRVAAVAVRRPTVVSRDLFAVLSAAQDLAVATGGGFDVTQAPVIRLWREARKAHRLPDAAALHEAAGRTGYRSLRLDRSRRTLELDKERMALDVGGIAKGYAASEALAALGGLGIRSAMVAVSGDLAFSGAPPGTRGWRIGLHDVTGEPSGVPAVIELANAAVSTAGPAEQHLDVNGRRYSHIVDPSTRMGLTDDLTVTVVATHGLAADGLDTAISVIGVERGLALIDSREDAVALMVRGTGAGSTVIPSSRFQSFVAGRRAR